MISNFIDALAKFYDYPLFTIAGWIWFTVWVFALLLKIIFWTIWISPVIFRVWVWLWKRRIAIISKNSNYWNLESTLLDSWIFNKKNIIKVESDLKKAASANIYLVDWESFYNEIDDIFATRSNHQIPVIIFAKPQAIPNDKMIIIWNYSNTVVVNFKWRLLNDILTSLITCSYDSK
jgi:hypothetical protein